MSNPDAPTPRPRRRGNPPEPAVSQPVTVASTEDAPILLRLPELPLEAEESVSSATATDGVAFDGGQAIGAEPQYATAETTYDYTEGPADDQRDAEIDGPYEELAEQEDLAEQYPADQRSSSEVRERRRKRRERQEPEQNVWSSASGRITIAGGVLLVCLVLVVVLLPDSDSGEPEGAWNQDPVVIEPADTTGEQTNPAQAGAEALLASGKSAGAANGEAWLAEDDNQGQWQPVESTGAYAQNTAQDGSQFATDGAQSEAAPGLQNSSSLAVQSNYGQAPAKVAQSTYTPPPADAYATQPANATVVNQPYLQPAAHSASEPTPQPYVVPKGSPGTYVPSGTQVASRTDERQYIAPQATMQPQAGAPYVDTTNTSGSYSSENPPFVPPPSPPTGSGPNDIYNPYSQ